MINKTVGIMMEKSTKTPKSNNVINFNRNIDDEALNMIQDNIETMIVGKLNLSICISRLVMDNLITNLCCFGIDTTEDKKFEEDLDKIEADIQTIICTYYNIHRPKRRVDKTTAMLTDKEYDKILKQHRQDLTKKDNPK